MNYKSELDKISNTIEQRKTEKTRIETQLDSLKKQREDIIKEITELGIKEDEIDNLKDIIANLEISIEEEINETNKKLEV